jgi:hypothetical protein
VAWGGDFRKKSGEDAVTKIARRVQRMIRKHSQLLGAHNDFNAAMTGRREARIAGRKLPANPTSAEKSRPFAASTGVIWN